MAKKKKEKITYVDDGRSVADMSGVHDRRLPKRTKGMPRATMGESWKTYKAAVKMMFGPMMVVVCGLLVLYMILYFIFFLMA